MASGLPVRLVRPSRLGGGRKSHHVDKKEGGGGGRAGRGPSTAVRATQRAHCSLLQHRTGHSLFASATGYRIMPYFSVWSVWCRSLLVSAVGYAFGPHVFCAIIEWPCVIVRESYWSSVHACCAFATPVSLHRLDSLLCCSFYTGWVSPGAFSSLAFRRKIDAHKMDFDQAGTVDLLLCCCLLIFIFISTTSATLLRSARSGQRQRASALP